LLENEEFFTMCRYIRSVWAPIKECINILESNTTTLADCFIHMIKLAVAIYQLLNLNLFKILAIHIFNNHYLEFQHPAYLLCYFMHPQYRGLYNFIYNKCILKRFKNYKNLLILILIN